MKKLKIYLLTLDGREIKIKAHPGDTILKIKYLYYLDEGVEPTHSRLIYRGKGLEDGFTLADYNIQKDSYLHLVFRLRGA